MSLFRHTQPVGRLQCNCTILGDCAAGEAVVIDPGDEVPALLAQLQAAGLRAVAIVHTHAHIDHIGGATALARATGAPTYLHPGDQFLYDALDLQAQFLGMPAPGEQDPIAAPLRDAMGLRFGAYELGVLHTPGHTPGSSSFVLTGADLCFAGDTLFCGSVGRTDLPGGDADALQRSIRDRLFALPACTQVICGHGPDTSIDRERRHNPYVRPL